MKSRLPSIESTRFLQSKYLAYITLQIALCIPSLSIAQPYIFTDLGTLGGTISQAFSINNSGQIVGSAYTAGDASSHATMWNGTTVLNLTPGVSGNEARGINEAGQAVGQSIIRFNPGPSGWRARATVWSGTTLTVLDPLLETTHSAASDINDSGQIVGRSIIGSFSGAYHATLWNGTTPTDLGANSAAFAINNTGQIAGNRNSSGVLGAAGTHATIWNGATPTDLGTLGGSKSEAYDINDSGLVVGYSYTSGDAEMHGTLWNGAGPIDLGTLGGTFSTAVSINNSGMIVGYSRTINNSSVHATLWDGSEIIDLNSLLDASVIDDGWLLETAYGINDNGWIVGMGRNSITGDVFRAFLLKPTDIPTPPTLFLFVTGLLGLIGMARKQSEWLRLKGSVVGVF